MQLPRDRRVRSRVAGLGAHRVRDRHDALRVEKLFQEYNNPGSFAVASLLTLIALVTLFGKYLLERYIARQMVAAQGGRR